MEENRFMFMAGTIRMSDFGTQWEGYPSAWLLLYCREGEVNLTLRFKNYTLKPGMLAVAPPDMYPDVHAAKNDGEAFYCLIDNDFATKATHGLPSAFYDSFYFHPVLTVDDALDTWFRLLDETAADASHPYRERMLSGLLNNFFLAYLHLWQTCYGDLPSVFVPNRTEALCIKFYNLILAHFREHHDTAYYADRLCITPGYLAMITRQICHETPKEAIFRQIILEVKHLLRTTSQTAEQIAGALNFPDTSYLCRFFRRHTGMSLGAYRQSRTGEH